MIGTSDLVQGIQTAESQEHQVSIKNKPLSSQLWPSEGEEEDEAGGSSLGGSGQILEKIIVFSSHPTTVFPATLSLFDTITSKSEVCSGAWILNLP